MIQSNELLFRMFEGWSSVETWRDPIRDEHVVRLTISDLALRAKTNPFDRGAIVDQLWPREVKRPRFHGVRLHGRIVGKWGQR